MQNKSIKIGIIGLGYVGLPLAVEFGRIFNVTGYDTNLIRIADLQIGIDKNKDILKKKNTKCKKINFFIFN